MSNKEKLTERWTQGRISEAMLRVYVRKGIISKGVPTHCHSSWTRLTHWLR